MAKCDWQKWDSINNMASYKSGILWVGLWRNLTFLSECQIFGSTMAGQSVSGHRSVSEGVQVIYRIPHSTLVQGTLCSRRSRSHSDQWVCSPLCLPYHWNINSQPLSTVYSLGGGFIKYNVHFRKLLSASQTY